MIVFAKIRGMLSKARDVQQDVVYAERWLQVGWAAQEGVESVRSACVAETHRNAAQYRGCSINGTGGRRKKAYAGCWARGPANE